MSLLQSLYHLKAYEVQDQAKLIHSVRSKEEEGRSDWDGAQAGFGAAVDFLFLGWMLVLDDCMQLVIIR